MTRRATTSTPTITAAAITSAPHDLAARAALVPSIGTSSTMATTARSSNTSTAIE